MTKRIYLYLWLGCLIGSWAVIPTVTYLAESTSPIGSIFLAFTLQAVILYGIVCYLSTRIIPKTGLRPFQAEKPVKNIVGTGTLYGVLVGIVIFILERLIFKGSALAEVHVPRWMGAISAIYGAINEEVLMRLFCFSLIYFLLNKAFKKLQSARLYLLWSANVIVAILFGLGHLPIASQIGELPSSEIARILTLNGVAGLTFGWLYFSRSLWTAMFAHFVADLMLHVVLI